MSSHFKSYLHDRSHSLFSIWFCNSALMVSLSCIVEHDKLCPIPAALGTVSLQNVHL